MQTSIVIPHVSYSSQADFMLEECVESLDGFDELILVLNEGAGYGKAFNLGFRMTKGEYIYAISNDTVLVNGSLKDLQDPTCVTTPRVNGSQLQFGCFFCMPRWVYEKVGGFDEQFEGAYFEDDDLLKRWHKAGVELKQVEAVNILHKGGTTVKAIMNESELMQTNRDKFMKKWGGAE